MLTPDDKSDHTALNATSRDDNDQTRKTSKTATRTFGSGEKPKKRSRSDQNGANAGLRFFVVDHPDQLKDKKQMRQNRQHVMHTYLDKEAKKPNSTDLRVRRQLAPQAKVNQQGPSAELPAAGSRQDLSRLTPPDSLPSDGSLYDASDSGEIDQDPDDVSQIIETGRPSAKRHITAPKSSTFDGPPLVSGMGGRYDHSAYMQAVASEVPWPLASYNLGGEVNAFETWPSFEDPALIVKELKFSCSQRFGSSGLTTLWLPAMLKARHAFLSTLCISSAHDDIMRRNILPPEQRGTESLMKRLRVRQGVISMINESLSNPEMRAADETIIAVLHVLHSEIMGCNDQSMQIHQIGLHEMVRERGGLGKLGLQGQLALCLAISMFLLAALRETLPHNDYMDYATEQNTKIPEEVSKLPESPIYCRPTGFQNINKIIPESSETFKLLDSVRTLTRALNFAGMGNTVSKTIAGLCEEIFTATPGWELDFRDMNERYRYESIRLASVVYAHAVSRRISLSTAAAELSDPSTRPASVILSDNSTPLPVLLKNALMRTDTSSRKSKNTSTSF